MQLQILHLAVHGAIQSLHTKLNYNSAQIENALPKKYRVNKTKVSGYPNNWFR